MIVPSVSSAALTGMRTILMSAAASTLLAGPGSRLAPSDYAGDPGAAVAALRIDPASLLTTERRQVLDLHRPRLRELQGGATPPSGPLLATGATWYAQRSAALHMELQKRLE